MDAQKLGPVVFQDAFFKKERPNRKKEVGKCNGNLYCPYDYCPFTLSTAGQRNASNFQNVDGHKSCFVVDIMQIESCVGHKMAEYCRESEILTFYHIGVQKFPMKPNTKKYKLQARETVLRHSGLGACGIQWIEVGEAVTASNIQEVQRRAM